MESHAEEPTTEDRLVTANALLIELGIILKTEALPVTLAAARKLLKTYVHLNVRDYLDIRLQGLEALRAVLHESKQALRVDVRKRRVALKKVNALGLRDLLVHT